MENVIPYLINLGDVIGVRSKATLLNEIAMALIECTNILGKKIKKLGKVNRITTCFWPVKLIPLNETRACVCSYLGNKQEKLNIGKFAQIPVKPDNLIKGADPFSFLDSLRTYNNTYLKKAKYFKRNLVIQEALFNSAEMDFFKNFFINQYKLSSFGEPYFILEGGPISKSVEQTRIAPEVFEFISQRDTQMLDDYGAIITKLCDRWVQKGAQDVDKIRGKTIDTSEEEKQLAILNKELEAEKNKTFEKTPEELVKSGKYKISDKTGDCYNDLNSVKGSVDKIKGAIEKRDWFLIKEGVKDLDLNYRTLGNTISRYKSDIANVEKSINSEIRDNERAHSTKIRELENKIREIQRQIDSKHKSQQSDLSSAEDVVTMIKNEKQSCLDNIERIKDVDMTDVQSFINNYTIEIKTKEVVVGIPIFIFYFVDPNSNRTTQRVPVLPILIDKGKVVSTKIKENFRQQLENMMNKDNLMINLVETKAEKNNLMDDIKNLDNRLEDAINDLRMKKVLGKKESTSAIEVITNLVW
ncbi:MAG: hypothetical protein ACFFBP_04260 [Promethearchaeota archaeon]